MIPGSVWMVGYPYMTDPSVEFVEVESGRRKDRPELLKYRTTCL